MKSAGARAGKTWLDASSQQWKAFWRDREEQVFLVLTLLIGAIVGMVVVAFILLTERFATRLYPAGGAVWRRLLVPVAGSALMGYLLQRFFPDARGSGVPQTKAALYARGGRISLETVFGKFFCTSATLASGIPLGREGPAVQVGAGIASVLGRRLGLRPEKLKALVPAGAAAAVAAAFNTPLAAVLFALEEVVGDLHAPVLGSVVLASATSWAMLRLLLGNDPLFQVPQYQLVSPLEFVVYAVLGVGYKHVGDALNGGMAVRLMVLLLILKLLAVTTSYASGNAGGIFGPSLFIGAMLGGIVGNVGHGLFPTYVATPGVYALVGMGTAFAGIVRAPMTSVVMIFETTRDYAVIVPLMISNLVSFFISSRLQRQPIYDVLAHQDGIHLPSAETRQQQGQRRVIQAMRTATEILAAQITVGEALEKTQFSQFRSWPVVDERGIMGIVGRSSLQKAFAEGATASPLGGLVDSRDFPHVHVDQSLHLALERLGSAQLDILPVVSRADVHKLEGIVTLQDVLGSYGVDLQGPK